MVSLQWQRWTEVLDSCRQRRSSGRFRTRWCHSAAVHQLKVPLCLKVDLAPQRSRGRWMLGGVRWGMAIKSSSIECKQITQYQTFVTSNIAGNVQTRKRKKGTDFPEVAPCVCFRLLAWVGSVCWDFVLRGLSTCAGNQPAFQETALEQASFVVEKWKE